MLTGSVRIVRRQLGLSATDYVPGDHGEDLAAHVAELERRVRRLNARGGAFACLRLSPDLLTWRAASEATA